MKDQREIIIPDLDYQAEVRKCKTMEDVVGKNGLMQKLFKDIIQQLLEAEMEEHLGRERHERSNEANPNYRNGYSSKTIESSFGEVGLDIPRDRKAQFEPKVVKKYETVCNELDKKISINEADLDLMITLPGIGEEKAKTIIAYRNEHGPFEKIEDIMNVSGIGEKLFEKIKDYITV